tara:strand:- start:9042 stop:14138 length:5097 start_codon:yes stop_codon:yes gene_type:complete
MQSIELDFYENIHVELSRPTVYKFRLPRYADLINFISMTISVPKIEYAGYFKWVDDLGTSMINSARLYMDDSLIEEIDGDFLQLYKNLELPKDKENLFNILIGNNRLHPSYDNATATTTIEGFTLNVPLLFCFFREKNVLPLISMPRREIFIEIQLKSLNEIYKIGQESSLGPNCPHISYHRDSHCVAPTDVKITPSLEINYVFLDSQERLRFANDSFSQLFSLTKRLNFSDIIGKNRLHINEYHPVQSMYIIAKRTDNHMYNEWNNNTNFRYATDISDASFNTLIRMAENEALANNKLSCYWCNYIGAFLYSNGVILHSPQFSTQIGSSGNILSIKLLRNIHYIHSTPSIELRSETGTGGTLSLNLKISQVKVVHSDNYYSVPNIYINNRLVAAKVILNGSTIQDIMIQDDTDYTDVPIIQIESLNYIRDLYVRERGTGYTSAPNIYIGNCKTHAFTPVIHLGAMIFFNRLAIVKSRDETDPIIYIGGELNSIIPSAANKNFSETFPSISFFDPMHTIFPPVAEFRGNNPSILSVGKGLTKHTVIRLGCVVHDIHGSRDVLKPNCATLELIPPHYSLLNLNIDAKQDLRNSIDPLFALMADPVDDFMSQCVLHLKELHADIVYSYMDFDIQSASIIIHFDNPRESITELFDVCLGRANGEIIPLKRVAEPWTPIVSPLMVILNATTDITHSMIHAEISDDNAGANQHGICVSYPANYFKIGDTVRVYIDNIEVNVVLITEYDSKSTVLFRTQEVLFLLSRVSPLLSIDMYANHYLKDMYYTLGDHVSGPIKIEQENIPKGAEVAVEIDHGGSGAECIIEFDYGGTSRPIGPYVRYTVAKEEIQSVQFKHTHHIWKGYRERPIFICKQLSNEYTKKSDYARPHIREDIIIPNITHSSNKEEYEDAIIEGILDYNITTLRAHIVLDKGGFGGDIELLNIEPGLYRVVCRNVGYNYSESCICTLVSYTIRSDSVHDVRIVEQFNTPITENGQLDISGPILLRSGTKGFNQIYISGPNTTHVSVDADVYIIKDAHRNIDTKYKLILGHIPDREIIVDECYPLDDSETMILYPPLQYASLFDISSIKYQIHSNVSNTLEYMEVLIERQQGFIVPLVEYTIRDGELYCLTPCLEVKRSGQLTGFKVLSGGKKMTEHAKTLYNNFITDMRITNRGAGYKQPPLCILTDRSSEVYLAVELDSGQDLKTEVILKGGRIVKCNVLDGGSGFDTPPNISIQSTSGSGGSARATIKNGRVIGIDILDGGENYYDTANIVLDKSLRNIHFPEQHKLNVINTECSVPDNYRSLCQNKSTRLMRESVGFVGAPICDIGGHITKLVSRTPCNVHDISCIYRNDTILVEDRLVYGESGRLGDTYYVNVLKSANIYNTADFRCGAGLHTTIVVEDIVCSRHTRVSIGRQPIIKIMDIGQELDSRYSTYKLLARDTHGYPLQILEHTIVGIKGANSDILNNRYTLDISGDGGGYGCTVHPGCIRGHAEAECSMEIGSIDILAAGSGYSPSDTITLQNYTSGHPVWNSLQTPYTITQDDRDTMQRLGYLCTLNNIYIQGCSVDISVNSADKCTNCDAIIEYTSDYYPIDSRESIRAIGIMFNNDVREEMRGSVVYNTLEKYRTFPTAGTGSNYLYSFCLDNSTLQPTGNCQFADLNKCAVDIILDSPSDYRYNVSIFLKYYNIIDYIGGESGLRYGN